MSGAFFHEDVRLEVRPRAAHQPDQRWEGHEVEGVPPGQPGRGVSLLVQPLGHLGELLAGRAAGDQQDAL
eukprot:3901362-Alexandrium_andersonii.AAC.1